MGIKVIDGQGEKPFKELPSTVRARSQENLKDIPNRYHIPSCELLNQLTRGKCQVQVCLQATSWPPE